MHGAVSIHGAKQPLQRPLQLGWMWKHQDALKGVQGEGNFSGLFEHFSDAQREHRGVHTSCRFLDLPEGDVERIEPGIFLPRSVKEVLVCKTSVEAFQPFRPAEVPCCWQQGEGSLLSQPAACSIKPQR